MPTVTELWPAKPHPSGLLGRVKESRSPEFKRTKLTRDPSGNKSCQRRGGGGGSFHSSAAAALKWWLYKNLCSRTDRTSYAAFPAVIGNRGSASEQQAETWNSNTKRLKTPSNPLTSTSHLSNITDNLQSCYLFSRVEKLGDVKLLPLEYSIKSSHSAGFPAVMRRDQMTLALWNLPLSAI